MNKKELIEYIKINDSLKEIDITLFGGGGTEKVFIISESSFQYKIDIKKFVQRKYTKEQIQSINSGGIRLVFTFDEIKLLKKNQKEFFIVNGQFLSKLGISIDPESSNILYYENNSQKYLYFSSEGRILMIEPGNDILQNTNTINIDYNIKYKNLIIELDKEKIKNKNLKYEINHLIKELNEEKQKNDELNNIIKSLTISTKININKISELEQLINNKNKELKNLNDQINNNNYQIKSIGPNEKIYALNFISSDQKIHYCIPCKNTDIFIRLEENLYKEYPKYKDYETYFLVHGKKIRRFKNLDENNIKSGDTIMLQFIDE